MGALVADIAAAFVLLVAGGCARAFAQPLWRRFVHWWHTEGNEPVEFKFMDRLAESMMAKPYRPPLPYAYREENSGKVLPMAPQPTRVFGKPCPEYDEQRRHIEETSSSISERVERLRKAEEELIRARVEEHDHEVWMEIAMQSGASRSEAEKRVERFHAMRNNSPKPREDVERDWP